MSLIGLRPSYRNWFSSSFFHKLYSERGEEAKEFIQNLVAFLQPAKQSLMLDTACGKGEQSLLLAEKGFDVTGLDLSFENIESAQQFEKDNLSFFQHDIRFLYRTNYYDYVFNLFNSIGYFDTRREQDDATRSCAAALKPGGIFVIDYLNTHYLENHLLHQEHKMTGGSSFEITRWDDENYFHKKIVVSDPSLKTDEIYQENYFKFSVGDFTDMLAFQNLQVMEVFGDYRLIPYHVSKTPRMIIVSKKKEVGSSTEQEKRLYSDGRKTDSLT